MFFADAVFVPDAQGDLIALVSPIAEAAAPLPPNDMVGTFVKMLLTLVALVALLILTYWFLRRVIQNRMQRGVGQQAIQILEKRMISPKTMLYLVQVENKKILFAESHLEVKALESFSAPLVEVKD